MSLFNCIKKAGKSISKSDSDTIKVKFDELVAKGVDEAEAGVVAVKEVEDLIGDEMKSILDRAGVKLETDIPAGVEIEIDGVRYDSNQFINDIDTEINGLDSIMACLRK
jgi:hypothetical protein